jgi:hypothetical protein
VKDALFIFVVKNRSLFLSLAEEVDTTMNDLNLLAPGHATMELDEALGEIDEAMQEIHAITQR